MNDYTENEIKLLSACTLCPRECGADRFSSELGYCNSDASYSISSICCHKGEEPVISGEKGICNIFFSRCNLQCNYCQNYHISRNSGFIIKEHPGLREIIKRICVILEETENIVGFVSPSHQIPQMLAIIRGLRRAGENPVFVYNTNAYDRVATLRMLEGIIDVYLPDFKYSDPELAVKYSQAPNYPEIAGLAIKEMFRQKGSSLIVDDRNIAQSGIIIRHLVLPGFVGQSINILNYIAKEISPDLHVSLMSQYYPTEEVADHKDLGRTLTVDEFERVEAAFHEAGLYRGWIQEMGSHAVFRPDFRKKQPF